MAEMNRRDFLRWCLLGLSACVPMALVSPASLNSSLSDWDPLPPVVFENRISSPAIVGTSIYHVPGAHQGKNGLDHSMVGLAKTIVDLVMIRPPDFAIIDALVGINTGVRSAPHLPGPGGAMRAILAGNDPVAVDTVACLAMNYDPASIGHIVYTSAVGLGIADPNKIQIQGVGIGPFQQDFQIPVNGAYRPSWYRQLL